MHARISGIVLASFMLFGLTATHCLAWHFGMQKALGSPLYVHELTPTFHIPIYAPWMIAVWGIRWGIHTPFLPQAVAAGFISAAALIAASIYGRLKANSDKSQDRDFGKDAWGTEHDLAKSGLLSKHPYGTILGTWGSRLIAYNGDQHQLITGGPGSGKTHGPLISSLLACRTSALILDPKRSLWGNTALFRSTLGEAVYFDPTDPDSIHINPLDEVSGISQAQNVAGILVSSSGLRNDNPIWPIKATDLLTGLILYTIHHLPNEDRTLPKVRMLIGDGAAYAEMARSSFPEVRRTGIAMSTIDPKISDSIAVTADASMSVFADKLVAEKTSKSDIRISDLMCSDRPMSLYLQVRASEAQRLKPLQRVIMSQIKKAALYDLDVMPDGRKKLHRLTMFLEEFPALGKDDDYQYELRQMREYGMTSVMACQSILDIEAIYGSHQTILDNCQIIVCFAASNPRSLKDISTLLGRATETKVSESRPRSMLSGKFSGSRNTSTQRRQLMDEGEIRRMAPDEELIFVTNLPPFKAKKVFWFNNPLLKNRGTNLQKGGIAPSQNPKFLSPDIPAQIEKDPKPDMKARIDEIISKNGWSKTQAASVLFPKAGTSLARHWISGTRAIPASETGHLEDLLRLYESGAS